MKLEGNGGRQLGIRHDLRLLIPDPESLPRVEFRIPN